MEDEWLNKDFCGICRIHNKKEPFEGMGKWECEYERKEP
jgi:hypothetical protein